MNNPIEVRTDELLAYEMPLINSSSSFISDNKCVTLSAAISGESYLWSTGETTQSIDVCNAGTYTCQVTFANTDVNQSHTASISITKLENQDNLPTPNGEVHTIYKSGNTVYYGGDFDLVGPPTGSGTTVDNTNAQPNTKFPRIEGTIYSSISDGKGGWYVGGVFNKVGNYTISNLVHINSDNSVDSQFNPQPNDTVYTMYLKNNSLYVGGAFKTIKNIPFNYLVKLDKITGDPDVWNAQCNGVVRSITLIKDLLVVGGDFSNLGGAARNYLGALDTTYVQATAWNPDPNNKVFKVYSTVTKLYVGGDFTTISGVSKSYGAGFSLPDFSTDVYNMRANGRIYDFLFNNNTLYVAGAFTSIGGLNKDYLAALNPLNSNAYSFNASADGIVRTLTLSNGSLIVGGDFSNIGGQYRNRLASLNLSSGVANDWNPSITGLRILNPVVHALSFYGNNIFVGGLFSSVGAISRNNAVAMDVISGKILPWNPSPNAPVKVIVGDNTSLYLGGDFDYIGGQQRGRIAQVNPISGLVTGWNPNADNTVNALSLKDKILYVGGEFNYIGGVSRSKMAALSIVTGSATPLNPDANGSVNALAIAGNSLYIGGDFTRIGGNDRNRLAAYQLSTNALSGFNPDVNGSVKTIATNENSIFVGGAFSTIGGIERINLAQLDLNGWPTSLNTYVLGQSVLTLALQDTSLYSGGDYNYYNCGYPINNLAAIKTNTSLLGYWQPQPDDIIRAICTSTNKIYVGGRFKQINGRYQPYFASLDIFNSGNPPVINNVPNMIGCTGAGLKIMGVNFVNILDVKVGDISVPFVVDSITSLTIYPNVAISGKVKVINAIGSNISTEIVTIYESPVADLTLTGSNLACEGSSISLKTDKDILLTYKWLRNNVEIPNATNATYDASLSGDYILQVTNAKGCITNSKIQSVLINAKPVVTVTADGPLTICEGTKLNLTVNTDSQNATYAWKKDGQYLSGTPDVLTKTYQVSSVESGNYTVEVTVDGCTTESSITNVQVSALPIAKITNSGLSTFCQGTSTTLNANIESGFNYSWFKDNQPLNGSTNSQNVNQTGNYTCKVTNLNNCSQISNGIFIKVNSLPISTITTNGNTTFCQGGNVTLTASTANSYLWSTGATTSSISVTSTGNYSVKVTDVNGCQNTSQVTAVKVNALPTAGISANGVTTFCQGQNVTLSSTTGNSYLWSTGETTQSILVNTTGNYSVKLTDANGCQNTSTVTNVIVNPLPVATITSNGKINYCQGESILVTLLSSNGTSYLWSNGATTSSISPNQSGSFTVQVTDANGCKATSQPVVVKMNSLPNVTATASKTAICSGENVTLTGGGASSYVWDNNVTNGISFVPSATKTYNVTGTDANGCVKTASVSVTVNSIPNVTATASKMVVCSGDNVVLTGSGASTYVWDNNVINGVSFIPTTTKTYTVTGTDANGCAKTAAINVTVNSLPTVIATATKTAVCTGDNVTLIGTGASTYSWDSNVINGVSFVPTESKAYNVTGTDANGCAKTASISVTVNSLPTVIANATKTVVCSGDNVILTGGGASTYVWDNNVTNGVSFVPSTTKTYNVTGTDANGCFKTASISVTVNSLPIVTAKTSKTIVCSGDNVTLTGGGATTYVWDNNVINGVSFVPTATKTYNVTGTDANGCFKTASISVTVNSLPTVIANASKTAVCSGDNVILTGGGASTYVWDNNITNGVSFVPIATKTYNVTGTDANGCFKTASISVTVNSIPNVTATASKMVVCSGDNVILTGSGASTYVWDNNVINGISFIPTTTKTYTVTGTDANGCAKTAVINVTVNSLPTVIATASKTAVCTGDNVTLTGAGASTYVWDNNVTNAVSFVPTATKTYNLTGTDANGCAKTASISVTVNSLPTVIANASKTAVCTGGNVTLTGGGASTYVWDNNVTNAVSFVPTATKTYNVTGTDANGCAKTASISVTVNSLPTVIANASKTTVCTGDNVTLTGDGASSYVWDNNVTNAVSFVPTTTKTYNVTGTDANGCAKTASISVTVNSLPTVIANASKTAVCTGDNVTLTGAGASTYVWDNEVTNGVSFTPIATKTYNVTGTDANGCAKTASVSVIVNNLPTVQIVSNDPTNKACEDSNLELYTDLIGSYLWSSGETTKNMYPSNSGVYSLYFTDINGCSNTSNSIKVKIFTLPIVSITLNGNTTYCSTNLTELVSTTAASYLWNSGETTKSIKPTQTGSYFVKITDINGCSQTSQPVDVIVNNCAGIENLDNLFIKTYPNPVTDYLMIEINETLVGKNYFVTDVAGKLLISGSFEKTINQIDFNQYASGSYMLYINEQTFKFIKE